MKEQLNAAITAMESRLKDKGAMYQADQEWTDICHAVRSLRVVLAGMSRPIAQIDMHAQQATRAAMAGSDLAAYAGDPYRGR
jgi:hypothetical protein